MLSFDKGAVAHARRSVGSYMYNNVLIYFTMFCHYDAPSLIPVLFIGSSCRHASAYAYAYAYAYVFVRVSSCARRNSADVSPSLLADQPVTTAAGYRCFNVTI